MPIIKFVNESEKIEYSTEQDVCSLLCYAFDPQKTIMNDNQFVGCKPFGFPFWYMRNPLAVHQFMEFNHKRQFKHWKDLAKHRVIYFARSPIWVRFDYPKAWLVCTIAHADRTRTSIS